MRKVILYMFTTLDGFIAGPNGEFLDYEPTAEEMEYANALFGSIDGILFGRIVYEGFVEYWDTLDLTDIANSPLDIEYARIFRRLTRVVFSRTLRSVPDNTLLIQDNIAEQITQLKQQPGKDFVLICGPDLLATLVQHGLVDEFILLVRPIAIGRGKALFGQISEQLQLELISTGVFKSGVVKHHYRIASATSPGGDPIA